MHTNNNRSFSWIPPPELRELVPMITRVHRSGELLKLGPFTEAYLPSNVQLAKIVLARRSDDLPGPEEPGDCWVCSKARAAEEVYVLVDRVFMRG